MMLCCSKCGAKAKPGCECDAAYLPARLYAAKAVAAHPEKSDRAIAKEIGVAPNTVKAARATAQKCAVEKRTGRDGKARKMPTRMTPQAADALRARAEAVARLFPPATKTIPSVARAELLAALKMLAKSRDTAAVLVERQRARLNLDWSDLLVPSDENQSPVEVRPLNGQSASLPPHDHAAILDGRTIYPSTVVSPREFWALKSGANWRKIGGEVLKGKWRRLPIYILNLEERATCPLSCRHYRSCYGNHMQWLQRMQAGPGLEWKLEREVALLSIDHDRFVVRLHGMGDFYSVEYVALWRRLLERHAGLCVFGYTARHDDDIADALRSLGRDAGWSRWAMRFSNSGE